MSILGILHERIAAVAPIVGVSVGDISNKATWRIDFTPEATAQQRADAQAVVDAFDPDAEQQALSDLLVQIKTTAQSAVGVALNDLTQAQIKALVAVLLWRAGAIENDGTIRALGRWAGQ